MVQLTEVPDEHFENPQPGTEDDGDFTDTDSEISEDSNFDPSAETVWERLYALRDIVPPPTRFWLWRQGSAASSLVARSLVFAGRATYVLTTSALLVAVPYALAYAEEQNMIAMEQEQRMREAGGQLLTAGADGEGEGGTAERLGAALGREGEQGGRGLTL